MATTEHPNEAATADRVAASLGDAGFVRVVAAPRADTVAALGVLCRALDDRSVPFQATIRRAGDIGSAGEATETVTLGLHGGEATHSLPSNPVTEAYAIASTLSTPDALLGLAGTVAGGTVATGPINDDATAAGLSRRAGLAIPTPDPVDGLSHSTLVHGPFSGDVDVASDVVGEFEPSEDAWRHLASDVALVVAESAPPASRAGTALERGLKPYVGGPFETAGGYADVLDALARRAPGSAIAAVLGDVDTEAALDVWRSHSQEVHDVVSSAELRRHDGFVITNAAVEAPAVGPAARLLRDYRSPESAVLVVGRDRIGLAVGDSKNAVTLLQDCVGDGKVVDGCGGIATVSADADSVETAVREVLGGGP